MENAIILFTKSLKDGLNFEFKFQVVNCICEFVEGSHAEIRSGWRPLFRALGGVSTTNHITSLLEVFQVFLNTENPLVFANAAMDFIHCLIKHVRGNGKPIFYVHFNIKFKWICLF